MTAPTTEVAENEAREDNTAPASAPATTVGGPTTSRKWGHIRSYIYTTDNRADELAEAEKELKAIEEKLN